MRGFRKVAIDTSDDVFYAKTKLPTEFGDFDVRIFREGDQEHLAISQGDLEGATEVTVRVHSECLTSEVLGSLKCDCKAQPGPGTSDRCDRGARGRHLHASRR